MLNVNRVIGLCRPDEILYVQTGSVADMKVDEAVKSNVCTVTASDSTEFGFQLDNSNASLTRSGKPISRYTCISLIYGPRLDDVHGRFCIRQRSERCTNSPSACVCFG